MDCRESCLRQKKRRCCLIFCVASVLLVVVLAVVWTLVLRQEKGQFQPVFFARCKTFTGYDCQALWDAFQKAYVQRDHCNVPMEAYDPLIAGAPIKSACNTVMLWSKTKDLVHKFTEKNKCFVTLEDTVLGFVLNVNLTWCGKEGSDKTFTDGCPKWTDCVNNPVRSFWNRTSAAFADAACGDVTVMLNGSIDVPVTPDSAFRRIEVERLSSPRVKSLTVILVIQKNSSTKTNCANASLKEVQKQLGRRIKYKCKEVIESRIQECIDSPRNPCGPCW
ncbi:ADP-ribosyl cyclase/cyclic ADP-ribose hydrolase 1-like [Embiotoca jacksoni]|uniref:ADP-ribosyl cyclase/cyclic ADP-ribose hydrolase 1-like n=1 Tax=Embiotoca jacksoni TaxID=100190 RepID=UPI0037042BDA